MPNGTIETQEIKLDAISTKDGEQIVTDIKSIQEELYQKLKMIMVNLKQRQINLS